MSIGKGFTNRNVSRDEVAEIVTQSADGLKLDGKRLLVIIPDGTRTIPMPLMFEVLQQELAPRAAACDYLVALGTHPLMHDEQLSTHLGQRVVNGRCGDTKILNHRWDLPETFTELGVIPSDE